MKTQHKLLIILLITAILLFSGFLIILQIQKRQNNILLNSGIDQQNTILQTAINAKSDLVRSTVYDYTYWDDMVNYLNKRDNYWRENNLSSLFSSFHVHQAWIYNLSLEPIYNETRMDSAVMHPQGISKDVFPILYRNKFISFYQVVPEGIMEIHGATIHSTNDEARKLPPRGYFFIAKLLDSAYVKELENLTGGRITFTSVQPEETIVIGNSISTNFPLTNWEGNTFAWMLLSKNYDSVTVFKRLSTISTIFLLCLIVVILIIFYLAFHHLVKKPLNKISLALLSRKSHNRLVLSGLKSEFRKIGALIDEYFDQQDELETEIEVRKKIEIQKEKLIVELDAANNELKDFAYIVSHDLKAPLRAIGSITQWIQTDYSDKLGEDGKMQLDLLLSRVYRMQNLIEGVLSYSRVTRTRELNELIDLNKTLKEAVEMVAPPEKLTITTTGTLPTVSFGPTRILQVFENLISNAVKYHDKPTGEINVSCEDMGEKWAVSVSDNGPGIEEKYHEKIFQIFQTLRSRDEFESTGIGLSIVKKIIENHGGTICVNSKFGQGTTFTFTILK